MNKAANEIRTPDQRLRIFVSSTLKELAEERSAVKDAINNLRLIPVMFEMGARPHPSDELYRAYLAQSQVFVGIYWQQYGWVAPGKDISGIEDEYLLAADLPKLIYLKSPAPDIEAGLKTMIRKIQADNSVSYKRFSTAEELQELVENDLALLLTEYFYSPGQITSKKEVDSSEEKTLGRPAIEISNLPVQPTQFIGREHELVEISNLLARTDVRLVTLTGPGGTGKTRLSLKLGERLLEKYPSGVHFIPLAEVREPELMISKIAAEVGVREGGSQPLLDTLKNFFREEHLLIILDNFEQIAQGQGVISELLEATSSVNFLVTSRTRLNLRAEYEFFVPTLTLPDVADIADIRQSEAFQLFSDRALAASSNFKVDEENSFVIAEICQQLDGLPLAIELAAARIKILSPEMILERLSSSLDVLTGGASDLPERQQTLRNTLDWSYSLLEEESQTLFRWLSVFAGGFSLEAAEEMCRSQGCEFDVFSGLEILIDNSLVRRRHLTGGEPRFSMLEVIREYAMEKLSESGELDAIREQHAQYFSNKMAEINLLFQTNQSRSNLNWIEIEHDNLRASLSWLLEDSRRIELGALLLSALDWFWFRRGYLSEGREWSQKMLMMIEPEERTAEHMMALFSCGALAMWQGDLKEALESIDKALEIGRQLEYAYYLAVILLFKGTTLVNMGEDDEALSFLEEALSIFADLGIEWYVATTRVHLANAALGSADSEKALENLKLASSMNSQLNEDWLESFILNNLGEVSRVRGEYDLAKSYYMRSEMLFREMGDTGELARLVHNLGYIALHEGDLDGANQYFQESLEMFVKLGNLRGIAENLTAIADVWIQGGDFESGARLFGAGQAIIDETGGDWWPADRIEIARINQTLEEKIASDRLEKYFSGGKLMNMEQAVSMAQIGNSMSSA